MLKRLHDMFVVTRGAMHSLVRTQLKRGDVVVFSPMIADLSGEFVIDLYRFFGARNLGNVIDRGS
jgi:hypothetical protein